MSTTRFNDATMHRLYRGGRGDVLRRHVTPRRVRRFGLSDRLRRPPRPRRVRVGSDARAQRVERGITPLFVQPVQQFDAHQTAVGAVLAEFGRPLQAMRFEKDLARVAHRGAPAQAGHAGQRLGAQAVHTNHDFLVFYRIGGDGGDGEWQLQELDFFIGPDFLVVTHDSEVPLLDQVFDRFCRKEGKKDVSSLLYDLLDAIVDDYFVYLDDLGERSQSIDERIFESFDPKSLEQILDLKRDLALLRRVVAPGRDAVNVLLRRDPPILDTAHIFYFQDVYDHLIRISDSIDTYRELATGSLDAFLSIQNNRISEIVRKLTLIR